MARILEAGDYFGTSFQQYSGDGIAISETHFAPDLIIPEHEHLHPFFCFVLGGRGTRSWASRSGQEAPMALTLFPAGIAHANRWYGGDGAALHLEFSSQWLQRLGGRTRVLERPDDFSGGTPVSFMRRLVAELQERDSATPLAVEGWVLELLASCERTSAHTTGAGRRRAWLDRAEALLRERFSETLTLDAIAADCHVSADYLAREFRKRFGRTVGEYVRELRLGYAREQLSAGRKSLAEIAVAAGFSDQSHFTRVFRRETGQTPGAYRAQRHAGRAGRSCATN